jgi:unsaturated chondroitin disaccharide hydrolase
VSRVAMVVDEEVDAARLLPAVERMWEVSAQKLESIEQTCPPGKPSPVFTVEGRYTARGWTEWTQGFQYGSALLQYDATGERRFLDLGRDRTVTVMAPHLSHVGVHDHGFNNVSTYGNLLRLHEPDRSLCELALKVSGAVQAARWRTTADGTGYIHSFNGPQSLFVDTIRSCRALALAHLLGHVLMGEQDERISLLDRLVEHATSTARWNIYYGEGRDVYDVRGRTAHESIFNVSNGQYRCPSTQQGYSPFSTWTRGLAWALLGYAELLEFLATLPDDLRGAEQLMRRAATATGDFYIGQASAADGVPYWDTGAPGLVHLNLDAPADPHNPHEPVDSSAAAIAAQGLLRLGRHLNDRRYWQAGLTICLTLLAEPYLSTDPAHQGLLLHSVYHRPNGWDHVAAGQRVPNGESSMWGDYHLREVALYLRRVARDQPYYTFFEGVR